MLTFLIFSFIKEKSKPTKEDYTMSHEIETIAYSGEEPWHGLGIKVPADLTPAQMQRAAGLNWTVDKVPLFGTHNSKKHGTGKSGLFRASDSTLLDVVSDDWNVVTERYNF